jgi:hypothetical protein
MLALAPNAATRRRDGVPVTWREVPSAAGSTPSALDGIPNAGEAFSRLLGDGFLALDRLELFRVGKDQPQQLAVAGVFKLGVRELEDPRLIASESDVNFVAGDVADDEDGRIAEVFLVEQQLCVRRVEGRRFLLNA